MVQVVVYRRGHDAVPVRADADRGGLLRSLVETIRGQRIAAVVAGLGFGVLLIAGIRTLSSTGFTGLADANAGGNVQGLAALIFTSICGRSVDQRPADHRRAGAMVLAHRNGFERRKSQRELAEERFGASAPRPPTIHQAQLRCLRSPQRRRHPGATARRLRFRHVRQRDPARRRGDEETPVSPQHYLYLSALLFTIGATGVLLRRSAIVMFMCVELMLSAPATWRSSHLPAARPTRRTGGRVLHHGGGGLRRWWSAWRSS